MGISAIDNAVTIAQQFLKPAEQKRDGTQMTILPPVVLPPADPSKPFRNYRMYAHRAANRVGNWSYLTEAERSECEALSKLNDKALDKTRIAGAGGALLGLGTLLGVTSWKNKNYDAGDRFMFVFVGMALGQWMFLPNSSGLHKCDKMHNDRLEAAARVVYDAAQNTQQERIATYAVSAEAIIKHYPSVGSLFFRDAWNIAERFSDAVVATAVYDAKYAGEVVENMAVPLVILGAAAFGVVKMVETGDTSTVQRTWAMVAR